jgi:hypothetical protein
MSDSTKSGFLSDADKPAGNVPLERCIAEKRKSGKSTDECYEKYGQPYISPANPQPIGMPGWPADTPPPVSGSPGFAADPITHENGTGKSDTVKKAFGERPKALEAGVSNLFNRIPAWGWAAGAAAGYYFFFMRK